MLLLLLMPKPPKNKIPFPPPKHNKLVRNLIKLEKVETKKQKNKTK